MRRWQSFKGNSKHMARLIIFILVVVVLLAGALAFFAGRDSTIPPVRVEKAVALENLQN